MKTLIICEEQMTHYLDFTTGNDFLDESIENYLIYGICPGGFATALLSNDLFLAAARADHWNKPRLADIASILYHSMPYNSFGTQEIVTDWIRDKDQRRSNFSYAKQREYTWKSLKGETQ
jgi:hypothetical protein